MIGLLAQPGRLPTPFRGACPPGAPGPQELRRRDPCTLSTACMHHESELLCMGQPVRNSADVCADCQLCRHHVRRRDHGLLRVAVAGIGGPDGPSNSPTMGQSHPAERSHVVPGLRSDNSGGSALGTPMQKHGSGRGSIAASASKDEVHSFFQTLSAVLRMHADRLGHHSQLSLSDDWSRAGPIGGSYSVPCTCCAQAFEVLCNV